jgi:hypothetical protein
MSFGFNYNITPDLARTPGLAFDAIRSQNPDAGILLSHTNRVAATSDAINNNIENEDTSNFWNRVIDQAGKGALGSLEFLGKPLEEVKKDYKYIHSVYTNHGALQGFAATMGVAGGATLGALVAGPLGLAAGAAVAGSLERNIFGRQERWASSFKDSENPEYKISPGRDFSNLSSQIADILGADGIAQELKKTDVGKGKLVSGAGDLTFSILMDPINMLGRFSYLLKTGKYLKNVPGVNGVVETQLKYPLMRTIPGVQNFLEARSLRVLNINQLDDVKAGGALNAASRLYNRALEDIATSSAGEIAAKFPELGTVAAGRLGSLKTADAVHDFFKTSLYFGELRGTLAGAGMLPSRSLLRTTFSDSKVVNFLRNDGSLPGRIYKTFSGYMPYSVDAETGKLSLKSFQWDSPDAASVVYRVARFAHGDAAAKEFAGQYAESVASNQIGTAKAIYAQTVFDTLKAAGLPDDSVLVQNAWKDIQKLSQSGVSKEIYGVGAKNGTDVSIVNTADGPRALGLDSWQASDEWSLPNYLAITKELRNLGKFSKVYGKLDDFAYKAYTGGIFKPLALLTLGFGLRITASELIPTFSRFGTINTFKASIAKSAAKLDYKMSKGEEGHVMAAAFSALGALTGGVPLDLSGSAWPAFREAARRGLKRAAELTAPEQFDLATKLIIANEGHILRDAISTGHGSDASVSYQLQDTAHAYMQTQKLKYRDLPTYTTYDAANKDYYGRLHHQLIRSANEPYKIDMSNDLLELIPEGKSPFKMVKGKLEIDSKIEKELIKRETQRIKDAIVGKNEVRKREVQGLARYTQQNPAEFATNRVDSFLGLISGKDGTYRKDFVNAIANKKKFDLKTLQSIDTRELPMEVAGAEVAPYIGSNAFQKIVDMGFRGFVDPVINNLVREQMYLMHVADEYVGLKSLIDNGLTEEQAIRIAQSRAVYAMLPQIHNTALRNQFAQLARNFLPFYFAQEQAMKRSYRLAKETGFGGPIFSRGLRAYQAAEHILNDPAFVQQDDQGNRYVYLPMVGYFGEAMQNTLSGFGVPMVSGLPISAQGNLVSLKTVLPEFQMPGVTPFVSIAGNIFASAFPPLRDPVKKIIGDISYGQAITDALIPSAALRTVWNTLPQNEQNNAMQNAILGAMQSAYFHGQVPGPDSSPMERQNFVDRIKNNARSILMVKAITNMLSPLAPRIAQEDIGLRDEWYKTLKSNKNYADAILEFTGKHGNSSISYTVSRNESAVPGAYLPYTQKALDYIDNNNELLNSPYGSAALFLIPQEDGPGDKQTIYYEYLRQKLRLRKQPIDVLNQFYIAMGDHLVSEPRTLHNQKVDELKAIGDAEGLKVENSNWQDFMTGMKVMHPLWYADNASPESGIRAQQIYGKLVEMRTLNIAPQSEQTNLVFKLMDDYETHQSIVAENTSLGIADLTALEKQNWETYLTNLRESEPRLRSVINSVFLKLGR